MKFFSFYLPQFHEIEENNQWWGKGFTEWTNIKKAKKIYYKQNQPKTPLDDNYYNLMDISTIKWQTSLMNEYGIDGFIYYHYYFQGKKLLEKPGENLLKHKEIKQGFFFCWANHSWRRSWNGNRELLIEQKYGNEEDWEKHFRYLLPFFKDDRYEKKDNKPFFMFFRSCFSEKNDIIRYFDKRCKDEGFNGIYIIETCPNIYMDRYHDFKKNLSPCSTVFYREPNSGMWKYIDAKGIAATIRMGRSRISKLGFGNYIRNYNGDKILELSMRQKRDFSDYIPGLFFEWDNTPRHEKRGYIITPVSHNKFLEYLDFMKNKEYVFINAWNEWCEGMIMEPTVQDGYKYLEWIKDWKERSGSHS